MGVTNHLLTGMILQVAPSARGSHQGTLQDTDASRSNLESTMEILTLYEDEEIHLVKIGLSWIWPPHSNSGKWRFRLGFPTKNVIILVVTVTVRGPHPRFISNRSYLSTTWICLEKVPKNILSNGGFDGGLPWQNPFKKKHQKNKSKNRSVIPFNYNHFPLNQEYGRKGLTSC